VASGADYEGNLPNYEGKKATTRVLRGLKKQAYLFAIKENMQQLRGSGGRKTQGEGEGKTSLIGFICSIG